MGSSRIERETCLLQGSQCSILRAGSIALVGYGKLDSHVVLGAPGPVEKKGPSSADARDPPTFPCDLAVQVRGRQTAQQRADQSLPSVLWQATGNGQVDY